MLFRICFWTTLMIAAATRANPKSSCADKDKKLIVVNEPFYKLSNSCNYETIQTLHLINNSLTSLSTVNFSKVSNLNHLLVVHNRLEYLDPHCFSNLTELIYLDLSYNKLKSLTDESIFSSQKKLKHLVLSYNQIVTLDSKVLAPLHSLKNLSLTGNNFPCHCELERTLKWCAEKNVTTDATCGNKLSWIKFIDENCTHSYTTESSSMTCILVGIGVGITFILGVVAEVYICCLRRVKRTDQRHNEQVVQEETLVSDDFSYYDLTSNNQPRGQISANSTEAVPCTQIDGTLTLEYAKVIRRQYVPDTGISGAAERGTKTESTATYAEPYQHTTITSETYAVPYHETKILNAADKVSVENTLYSQ